MNESPERPLPLYVMEVGVDEGRPGAITIRPHILGPDGSQLAMPLPFSLTRAQALETIELIREMLAQAGPEDPTRQ